jgi:hypothetical protein
MKKLTLTITALLAFALPASSQLDVLATWDGAFEGEQFGIAVAMGGDWNGDGYADAAVGSSTSDEGGANAGKVSIFLGRPVALSTPDAEVLGPEGSFFGAAVAWAGDVDDDGYDDLLVGAYRDTQAGANAGKAFLFLGGEPPDTEPDLVLVGPGTGAYFGRAVAGAGDLNGDGFADLAVGAPRTANGDVHIFLGGDPPDGDADLILTGEAADDRFGSSVAGAGNADGVPGDDILVGAARAGTGRVWQGAAYLFSGGDGMDADPDWIVRGEGSGDQLGTSVAAAGDVNGDGDPDILVGAPYWNSTGALDAGSAYLYLGGALLDTTPDFSIEGTIQEENVGRSVAGCGDVTGSGYGHILAGAPGGGDWLSRPGRAFLSPGGDPPNAGDTIELVGEADGDQFGHSVSGGPAAPSFAGDPRPEVVIGAWAHGTTGQAAAYGLADGTSVPIGGSSFALSPPAPNPATLGSVFSFQLPVASTHIRLTVHDVSGRLVRVLANGVVGAGRHSRSWDLTDNAGNAVASGVYFAHLEIDGLTRSRKLVVLR